MSSNMHLRNSKIPPVPKGDVLGTRRKRRKRYDGCALSQARAYIRYCNL